MEALITFIVANGCYILTTGLGGAAAWALNSYRTKRELDQTGAQITHESNQTALSSNQAALDNLSKTIETLQNSMTFMKLRQDQVEAELVAERTKRLEQETDNEKLRGQIRQLTKRIVFLEGLLDKHEVEIPKEDN